MWAFLVNVLLLFTPPRLLEFLEISEYINSPSLSLSASLSRSLEIYTTAFSAATLNLTWPPSINAPGTLRCRIVWPTWKWWSIVCDHDGPS